MRRPAPSGGYESCPWALLSAGDQKTAPDKAAGSAANKRFGELGDYNMMNEVTVRLGSFPSGIIRTGNLWRFL